MSNNEPNTMQRFLRRGAPPPRPRVEEPTMGDIGDIGPEVTMFLERYRASCVDAAATARDLQSAHIEIDKLNGRIEWLQQELTRCAKSRDEHQLGFVELKAQFAILVSTAMANHSENQASHEATHMRHQAQYESFIKLCEGAMQAVRDRMLAGGVDPSDGESRVELRRDAQENQEKEHDELEEGIAKIAAKHGANNPRREKHAE